LDRKVDFEKLEDLVNRLPENYHYTKVCKEKSKQEVLMNSSIKNSTKKHLPNVIKDAEDQKISPINPVLVNQSTGRADLMKIMKEFSFLTFNQIDRLWKQFKKFDKNDDHTLDFNELIGAIRETEMLDIVRQSDVRSALEEVDLDCSGSVDFYEFIKVGEMIVKKQGSSDLFKYQMLNRRDTTGQRFCNIQ